MVLNILPVNLRVRLSALVFWFFCFYNFMESDPGTIQITVISIAYSKKNSQGYRF